MGDTKCAYEVTYVAHRTCGQTESECDAQGVWGTRARRTRRLTAPAGAWLTSLRPTVAVAFIACLADVLTLAVQAEHNLL